MTGNQRRVNFAIGVLVLLICADLATGLLFNLGFAFYRVGLPLKSVVIFLILILNIRYINVRSVQSVYLCMLLLVGFWLVGSGTSYFSNPNFSYAYSFLVLNRYFLFLILSLLFLSLKEDDRFAKKSGGLLDGFFLFNNSLIFAGAIFDIDLFSTYDPTGELAEQRFGYKGLIFGGNDVAAVYFLGVSFYMRETLRLKRRRLLMLVFTVAAAFLTGTKATFVGVMIVTFYYLLKYKPLQLGLLGLPTVLAVIIFIQANWATIKSKYLAVSVRLYEETDVLTFLMTGRNLMLKRNFVYAAENWSWLNYFTGDGYLYSETDFFDIYFFFGLGSILYLFIYVKVFFLRDKTFDNHFIFFVAMALAFFGGHFIQSAVVPVFLLLFVFSYNLESDDTIRDNWID